MAPPTLARFAPYAIFAFGLLALDVTVPRYARSHFIPEQMMHSLGAARPEVVLIGNSLLAAGYRNGVRTRSRPSVFNAAIGATTPLENFVTLRRVLAQTEPKTVVYGWYSTQLVDDAVKIDDIQGNRLVSVLWANTSDLSFFFPRPQEQPIDVARFLLMKHVPLAAYAPLVQGRLEISRRGLAADKNAASANPFGADADFRRMADASWNDIDSRLEKRRTGSTFSFSRFVVAMRDNAHSRGAKIVWVAMPLASRARATASASATYQSYVEAAHRELASAPGDRFLDASELAGIDDGSFADGLHLNERGARVFTQWLDDQLAPPDDSK
ncbi:hypothetical protein LVJ94_41170 [Pendulispora rubella]|uniref:SGNH hydrolase-type esterase domain-containing protein n=1 Tax=Pendulispora rubella TaxID=2741070 RepID=A0ABZ2KXT9_9BACT